VYGLDHEGNLVGNRRAFSKKAAKINQYVQEVESDGFRSTCMYRNIDWYEELKISYDMLVPNVAHLEPQRGGLLHCFPYFVGKILEPSNFQLPLFKTILCFTFLATTQ